MVVGNIGACIACSGRNEPFIDRIWDDRYGSPGIFSVLKCESCGQMVTAPPLLESDLPGLYSRYYPRGDVDFDAIEREAAAVLVPRASEKRYREGTDNQGHYAVLPGQSVLDIGCGSCVSLLEVRNLGGKAFGVEADPNVRAIAEHFGLDVHIGSIHDDPFPGQTFDLIVLNQVIEHVPEPLALLRLVRERLAPGGKVILAFPNTGSLNRKVSRGKWINWHIPYHLHHYNKKSFGLIAARTGYRVASMRTITPNVWTILQLRAFGDITAEGQASSAWTGRGPSVPSNTSFAMRWKNRFASRVSGSAGRTMTHLNRLVDRLGLGDSLLVVLQKQD
ncbi:class I SAM-dependent methyltransferase [Rhizobium leguminosarum]|uniref:class I SAM-dependent methyltransferase n=1 Tax=Rhizobium leguminosarum TaxID=384 RepID=UPI001C983F39|nr:class I SAM-dependent methyltransferase [Rhizobium leguminosarum]MBY5766732.1 class I SAM-dependent methyltransferase [Rhizobium leguminosarum]